MGLTNVIVTNLDGKKLKGMPRRPRFPGPGLRPMEHQPSICKKELFKISFCAIQSKMLRIPKSNLPGEHQPLSSYALTCALPVSRWLLNSALHKSNKLKGMPRRPRFGAPRHALPVEVRCYTCVYGCLARDARCNTMPYLTADAVVSYMSRAKHPM